MGYNYQVVNALEDISGALAFVINLFPIIAILVLIGYIMSLSIIYSTAIDKNRKDMAVSLVIIGIFLTPIISALLLIALPDKNDKDEAKHLPNDEFPDI